MRNAAGVPQGGMTSGPLKVGAGGFITGLSISNDGLTKVIRGDACGVWVKASTDTTWRSLLKPGVLPVGEYQHSAGYTAPAGGLVDSYGGYEAVVAPSDKTRLYVAWNSRLYRSDDTGATLVKTALPDTKMIVNETSDSMRLYGKKIAVDPQNPDVFLLGTHANGLYWSSNKGTTVTNVVIGANSIGATPNPHLVACDPTGTVTSTIKQRWFAVRQGTGVYVSTTGPGGTYTLMSGSPTQASDMRFDQNGNCWVCDPSLSTNNVWKCAAGGTTWAQTGTVNNSEAWFSIAIDPLNANRIVIISLNGDYQVSSNGGTSWLGADRFISSSGYPDTVNGISSAYGLTIPWLALGKKMQYFPSTLAFDPVTSNKLWLAHGLGVSSCQAPTLYGGGTAAGRFDFIEDSEGIEMLVANKVLSIPGGSTILCAWDKSLWRITDPSKFARLGPYIPGSTARDVQSAWDADYAKDNINWIAALVNQSGEFSGYSTDGGTTWSKFPVAPPFGGAIGGCLAVGNAGNVVILTSNNAGPVYTKDGGNTWATPPFPGLPSSPTTGFGWAYYNTTQYITHDGTAFYAYNYGGTSVTAGVYKSTTQGDSWTRVFTGNIISNGDQYRGKLRSVPGHTGHLFFCDGAVTTGNLKRSTDGGVTWTSVTNVTSVGDYGFGASAPGQSYPAIYFYGQLSGVWGCYRSDDNFASTPKLLAAYPANYIDNVSVCTGDMNKYGRVYLGYSGSGFVYGDYDSPITLS